MQSRVTIENIINWETIGLYPLEIFNLPEQYTERELTQAYHKLAIKFHPDKNLDPQSATAFQMLSQAREYLLFDIASADFTQAHRTKNIFYAKFNPSPKQESKAVDERAGYLSFLAAFESGNVSVIPHLKRWISFDQRCLTLKTELWERSVTYIAAMFNQVEFFDWLIDQGAKPEWLNEYKISPLYIALLRNRHEILKLLIEKKGRKWLQQQINSHLTNDDTVDFLIEAIHYYQNTFTPKTQAELIKLANKNPYVIPAIAVLGYISPAEEYDLVKSKIIDCPELYTQLSEELRLDNYIMLAALYKNANFNCKAIPYEALEPHYIYALMELYPPIKDKFKKNAKISAALGFNWEMESNMLSNFKYTTGAVILAVGLLVTAILLPQVFSMPLLIGIAVLTALTVALETYAMYHGFQIGEHKKEISEEMELSGINRSCC